MALREQLYSCFKHWTDNGPIWVISDPHFSESLEECGFAWKPSDEDFIRLINQTVGKHDTLIILGDVGNVECVKKLKGYKVLITGNHDKGVTNYLRKENFITVPASYSIEDIRKEYPDFKSFADSKLFEPAQGYKVIYTDNRLFDEVYDGPLFISKKVILSHEPIIDSDSCFYNIHGHKHNDKRIKTSYSFNVCADAIHFIPMNLGNLLASGVLSDIRDIHRFTIDTAVERNKLKQNAER